MKRRLIATLSCFIVLILMASRTFATGSGKLAEQLDDPVNNKAEWAEVQASVEAYISTSGAEGLQGMGRILYEDAYKAYEFTQHDFIHVYDQAKSLEALVSDKYMWIVPTKLDGQFRVVLDDKGEWITAGHVGAGGKDDRIHPNELLAASTGAAKLQESVQSKHLIAQMYYIEFIYVQTADGEYLVPNSSRTDFSGLENGRVYPVSEVIKTLQANYPLGEGGEDIDGGPLAGIETASSPAATSVPWIFTFAVVLLFCSSIVGLLFFRRHRALQRK